MWIQTGHINQGINLCSQNTQGELWRKGRRLLKGYSHDFVYFEEADNQCQRRFYSGAYERKLPQHYIKIVQERHTLNDSQLSKRHAYSEITIV